MKRTFVVEVNLSSVHIGYTATNALHARLDHFLCFRCEASARATDLHVVGDHIEAEASFDGAAGDDTMVQGILQYIERGMINRTKINCSIGTCAQRDIKPIITSIRSKGL